MTKADQRGTSAGEAVAHKAVSEHSHAPRGSAPGGVGVVVWFCLFLLAAGIGATIWIFIYVQQSYRPTPPVPQSNLDVPFVSTPHDVVAKMIEMADVKESDLVYDLGCGDGRIVVMAAEKHGCRGIGVDLNPDCVLMSQQNAKQHGVEHLVTIKQEDIFDIDLSEADVVMLYLYPEVNVQLLPQLQRLKPGARIVSHNYDMKDVVEPDAVEVMQSKEDNLTHHTIYLWTTPLNIQKVSDEQPADDGPVGGVAEPSAEKPTPDTDVASEQNN